MQHSLAGYLLGILMSSILLPILTGCASAPAASGSSSAAGVAAPPALMTRAAHRGTAADTALDGPFAATPAAGEFVQRMASAHGFERGELARLLSQARREQWIIDAMNRQAPRPSTGPTGAWTRYRAKFLTAEQIDNGARFWRRHEAELERAAARYGVPPQYIVAIIGVETRYGGYLGNTRVFDALATLAFAYPRRAAYFQDELESFLVMARDEGFDPREPRGSFAGAMGLGQFMPSSFRDFAVDFDGDGRRDLWHPVDAIGSVANYFKHHGWRAGEPVAVPARLSATATPGALKTGFDTRYSLDELAAKGIAPTRALNQQRPLSLLRLDVGDRYDYWLGLHNFFVITRYNHSSYYAMAVHQLAEAIAARRGVPAGARMSLHGDVPFETDL